MFTILSFVLSCWGGLFTHCANNSDSNQVTWTKTWICKDFIERPLTAADPDILFFGAFISSWSSIHLFVPVQIPTTQRSSNLLNEHLLHCRGLHYSFLTQGLPVAEAARPGMLSSPDTRTFSGRRCIMDSSAGCFFMPQSRCAPSTIWRWLLSAKTWNNCVDFLSV